MWAVEGTFLIISQTLRSLVLMVILLRNEISVNAVDVIYAAMPAYITLWPDLLGYLLTPLLEFQSSDQYTLPFAAQDIGMVHIMSYSLLCHDTQISSGHAYPNATGNTDTHNSQIEQTANMLILSLAHAQYTGNGTLLAQYVRSYYFFGLNSSLISKVL